MMQAFLRTIAVIPPYAGDGLSSKYRLVVDLADSDGRQTSYMVSIHPHCVASDVSEQLRKVAAHIDKVASESGAE